MKILVGGDVVPTVNNEKFFIEGNVNKIIDSKILNILNDADFISLNLEVPLINEEKPISKYGPNLIACEESIRGLKIINPHFFTLANNHILDQGEEGLLKTMKLLEKNNIDYSGVGRSLSEAKKPYIKVINGIRIGIYCCVEHEFSVATATTGGANPFDYIDSFDEVADLRGKVDCLIVLYHGGKEHYRYPSPQLQRICRKFVDKGADFVICQHSHCIGCEESWNVGKIIYGQGNFHFDFLKNEFWMTSLLIEININNGRMDINYIPVRMEKGVLKLAEGEDKIGILRSFYMRSEEILEAGYIEKKYLEFAKAMQWEYFSGFLGKFRKNIFFRLLNKLSGYKFAPWYLNKQYGDLQRLQIQNYIECEAHRELMIAGIRNKVDQ